MTDIERRIRAATGWDSDQYRAAGQKAKTLVLLGGDKARYQREYDRLKAKVRNYNRLTGQNVSAAKMLYNKYAFSTPSQTLRTIEKLPTSRLSVSGISIKGQTGKEVTHARAGELFGAGYTDFFNKFGDPRETKSTYGFFSSASEETRKKFAQMLEEGATPAELFGELIPHLEQNRQARKAGGMRGKNGTYTGSDI